MSESGPLIDTCGSAQRLDQNRPPRFLNTQTSDDGIDELTDRLLSGERITVGSQTAGVDILRRIGLSGREVDDRFRHAGLEPGPIPMA